ncbi:uncharacterized protein PG998_008681 [Apiospora kogelbergensis]|uniref:uncharacterized protein n=1 Tax=Apiospora kogelbergensis TaxID=1337665 RepID=UPI0031324C36
MTSVQSFGGLRSIRSSEKIHKPRSSKVVKPILKKLSQSQSEKNSLDLDRGWDEQDEQFRNQGWSGAWDAGADGAFYATGGGNRAVSSKDVTFALGSDPLNGPVAMTRKYHNHNHSRSISGASHVSVATSGSGSAVGLGVPAGAVGASGSSSVAPRTFVHPFQQIPRTATPPISYANSLASSYVDNRDYSPTITEDEDYSSANYDLADPTTSHISLHHYNNSSSMTNIQYRQQQLLQQTQAPTSNPSSRSQPSLVSSRPSLATHRTASYTDAANSHPSSLRINTTAARSIPAQSSRLANVSSQTDLNAEPSNYSPSHPPLQKFSSPSSTVSSSISPVMRSSFEAVNFPRLRAKSDLDTATRQDHLREARRKFEAREQAKEEKYAREQIKRREREDNKRALEAEKQAKAQRKEREAARQRLEAAELAEAALPHNKQHTRKTSGTSSSGRPSMSRLRSSHRAGGGASQQLLQPTSDPEKFGSGNYESMETRTPPAFGQRAGTARAASYEAPRRSHTAKRKTHGAWTVFILWLRTRLLRLKTSHNQ